MIVKCLCNDLWCVFCWYFFVVVKWICFCRLCVFVVLLLKELFVVELLFILLLNLMVFVLNLNLSGMVVVFNFLLILLCIEFLFCVNVSCVEIFWLLILLFERGRSWGVWFVLLMWFSMFWVLVVFEGMMFVVNFWVLLWLCDVCWCDCCEWCLLGSEKLIEVMLIVILVLFWNWFLWLLVWFCFWFLREWLLFGMIVFLMMVLFCWY